MPQYICLPAYDCRCYPRGRAVCLKTMLNHRRAANDRCVANGPSEMLPRGPRVGDADGVLQEYAAIINSAIEGTGLYAGRDEGTSLSRPQRISASRSDTNIDCGNEHDADALEEDAPCAAPEPVVSRQLLDMGSEQHISTDNYGGPSERNEDSLRLPAGHGTPEVIPNPTILEMTVHESGHDIAANPFGAVFVRQGISEPGRSDASQYAISEHGGFHVATSSLQNHGTDPQFSDEEGLGTAFWFNENEGVGGWMQTIEARRGQISEAIEKSGVMHSEKVRQRKAMRFICGSRSIRAG